jgi:Flp pilus assembly protein TadD
MEPALDSFRHAIASNPKEVISYKLLALLYVMLKKLDDALQVWQDLAKAVPDDPDASLSIGEVLITKKRYAEAVSPLESAVKLNAGQSEPLRALATVYLHTGKDSDAATAFEQAIQLDPSPLMKNNVAWELAVANKSLDVALRYAQDAVHDEEIKSATVRLDQMTNEDLAHTQSLSAYWDTLGWVHYQRGDFKQAENYLNASWMLRQRPASGTHLGIVYEKEKRLAAASHMYQLVSTLPANGGDDEDALDEAKKGLVRLKVAPATTSRLHPDWGSITAELNDYMTSTLPRLAAGPASAEFFVLFAPGPAVEDTKFISGTDNFRSAGKALRSAKFKVAFPEGSSAKLVRRGILTCYPARGCSFVLLSPETVRNIN